MTSHDTVRQAIIRGDLIWLRTFVPAHSFNSYMDNGSTYITWAVRKATIETIVWLLMQNADINLREKNGATPLLLAIHLDRPEVVTCLISNKVDVNLGDSYDTPLTAAVQQGNVEIIELLIGAGVSAIDCDFRGTPPLIIAIKQNKLPIVELFLKRKLGTNVVDEVENTPLIAAIRNNSSLDVVRSLLKHGANPNETKGLTNPLLWAIKLNNSEILEILLEYGANVDIFYLDTLLIHTIQGQFSLSIMECLLKHNPNNANQTKNEKTPIAWAITTGNHEAVQLLLTYGANVNIPSLNGNTPLATSVEHKQLQIAKCLLENDAIIGKTVYGKTPLLLAVLNEDLDMIKLLLEHGADYTIHQVFFDAIATRNVQVVQLLNERQSLLQVDIPIVKEMTPLKKSLQVDSVEMAKYFIENGAKVVDDLEEKEPFWIIHFLEKNHFEMVKLLTENGARINEWSDSGDTVLTWSIQNENFDMVKYFLTQGASANHANKNGLTPLAIAESKNDFKTFQYLVECGANLSDEDKTKNPNLVMYYQITKQKIAKREMQSRDAASNQESA